MLIFLVYLLVGLVSGLVAGLFGIGGGAIIVPVLLIFLPFSNVPDAVLMSTALGTSFAIIVVTACASAYRHHQLRNVDWRVVKMIIPYMMGSVFLSGLVVVTLPKDLMKRIFAVIMLYLAYEMFRSAKAVIKTDKTIRAKEVAGVGVIIGALSSLAGIGGGSFMVPYFSSRGMVMRYAIGTSAFCVVCLSSSATISFILGGINQQMPDYSIGFVYLPAFIGIAGSSFFTAKWGADLSTVLPVAVLKRAFAVLLMSAALTIFLK